MSLPRKAYTMLSEKGSTEDTIRPILKFACTICGESRWAKYCFNSNGRPSVVSRCQGVEASCQNEKGRWMTFEEYEPLMEIAWERYADEAGECYTDRPVYPGYRVS